MPWYFKCSPKYGGFIICFIWLPGAVFSKPEEQKKPLKVSETWVPHRVKKFLGHYVL